METGKEDMDTDIECRKVERWLDVDFIADVERLPDEESEFNQLVQLSGFGFHVIKTESGGPLSLVSTLEFNEDQLELLLGHERERFNLLTQFRRALTRSPGWYKYVDENGTVGCSFRNMRAIQLEYCIYPDGASQQTLLDGLLDMANALVLLRDGVDTAVASINTRQ